MTERLQAMMISGPREYTALLVNDADGVRAIVCRVTAVDDITVIDYEPDFDNTTRMDLRALTNAVAAFDSAAQNGDGCSKSISRQEARERFAAARIASLSAEARTEIVAEWWTLDSEDDEWSELPIELREELEANEEPPSDATPSKYDPLIRLAVMRETLGVRNSWLHAQLCKATEEPLQIVGEPEALLDCACCGHLTLRQRGGFEICPVCFWEDDGSRELHRSSSPNHMTLGEAKANFSRFGACSEAGLEHIAPDARAMYPRLATTSMFTFMVDHMGGTYLSQAIADNVKAAVHTWAANLRTTDFGGLTENELEDARAKLLQDSPIPITRLTGVWCISTLVRDHLMLVHIVEGRSA